jgi:RecA-family ATPase
MLTLTRPAPAVDSSGGKIPMPLHSLRTKGAELRRSEVSMIAGMPGAGKSALALHLAVNAVVPTLYFAADTSRHTMQVRTDAMLTGRAMAEAEGKPCDQAQLADGAGHIAWVFDASPSMDDVRLEVSAFEEVHGSEPELIVIDNLIDLAEGGGDEWQALRATMKDLKVLARDTQAAVLVLHHVSESTRGVNIMFAPPRGLVQGKVAQLPALILTIDTQTSAGSMVVGVVKNRYGMAAANGGYGVSLDVDLGRMSIQDPKVSW